MFNFKNTQDMINSFTSFKNKYDSYRSANQAEWQFYETVEKLKYLFSGYIEQYFIETFYKLIEAKQITAPKFYEECDYDSIFSHNDNGFLLEFKRLHNTTSSKIHLYIPYGKKDYESLPFATAMLHTDKYNRLANKFNKLNEQQRKQNRKEFSGVLYLCYLENEQRLIYKSIYSKSKDLSGELVGSAEQPWETIGDKGNKIKQSYYLDLNTFKEKTGIMNPITAEEIIEENGLQWLYNSPDLLGHIITANKLPKINHSLANIQYYKLSEKQLKALYDKYKK